MTCQFPIGARPGATPTPAERKIIPLFESGLSQQAIRRAHAPSPSLLHRSLAYIGDDRATREEKLAHASDRLRAAIMAAPRRPGRRLAYHPAPPRLAR